MLRRRTSQPKERVFSTYDLEWTPHTLDVRICGYYDGETYRHTHSLGAFLDQILTPENEKRWFYAHAGGLYDLTFLLDRISKNRRYKVKGAFSGSALIVAEVSKGAQKWHFCDSFWLLRAKLEDIGKDLGYEKGGKEYRCAHYPLCGHAPKKSTERVMCIFYAPYSVQKDYNERDCVLLWKAIDRFQDTILTLGGQLQKTIASTGMDLFCRRFLNQDIETFEALNTSSREAYTSSRVEVFDYKCEDADDWDMNSCFPHAMKSPLPGKYLGSSFGGSPYSRDILTISEVTVEVPKCYLPPLPYRQKERVFFPTGRWRSRFTNVDLELLEEAGGRILSVGEVFKFEPFYDCGAYAETLYEMRRSSKEPYFKLVLKFLLNSLYGKFAEGDEKDSLLIHPAHERCPHNGKHEKNECMAMLFPGVYVQTDKRMPEHCHVPISVFITSLARAALWRLMIQPVKAGNPIFYCDTDGFVCRHPFPSSDKLGELKHVRHVKEGIFIAPKLYRLDEKVKAKGFRSLTPEEFERVHTGEEIRVERMMRIKELYRTGSTEPLEKIFTKKLTFKQRPKRSKVSGGGTRPWDVKELT